MMFQLFQVAEHNLGMEMNCSHWGMNEVNRGLT